jgi:hypothetical protein
MTTLKTGARFRSAVCATEIIVTKAPDVEVDLRCGGQPMLEFATPAGPQGPLDPDHASGTLLGKRYVHATSSLDVLCTKSGEGSLTANGDPLEIQVPKKLPSND